MRLVIVTGMSGAGKTTALKMLEDMGFYCVDNLPIPLIGKFAELAGSRRGEKSQAALGIDIRSGESLEELGAILKEWDESRFPYEILFLDAGDEVLIKRYKETRRSHPLAEECDSLEGAIALERRMLAPLRERAEFVVDTSDLSTAKLRGELLRLFGRGSQEGAMTVSVTSFGFKHGLPREADLVFDVRFLPNPYYVQELRPRTGLDDGVRDYVFSGGAAGEFLEKLQDLVGFLLPKYVEEGKTALVVAVGCTGGHHRSVAIAHALAAYIRGRGYPVTESHRDLGRT